MKWQYAQAYAWWSSLLLSRYQNTSKNKGFISDGSARSPRFLVHFFDLLCKEWHKISVVKVVRIMLSLWILSLRYLTVYHNAFRYCCVRFYASFGQPFSKQLCARACLGLVLCYGRPCLVWALLKLLQFTSLWHSRLSNTGTWQNNNSVKCIPRAS